MNNYNSYDIFEKECLFPWRKDFEKTDIFKKIKNQFEIINNIWWDPYPTPRKIFEQKMISLLPFYFIDNFLCKNNDKILDIGCGMNEFKNFYSNIFGVDPFYEQYRDDKLNKEFWKSNYKKWNNIMSINALHFIPIKMLSQRIIQFHNLLNTNGVGYLALNYSRLRKHGVTNLTDQQPSDYNAENDFTGKAYAIEEQIKKCENIIAFKLTFYDAVQDEHLNGNIHLIIKNE